MSGQIRSLEVSYFVHATEDKAKLDAAVVGLLGVEGEPEVESLEGHFGNEIVLAKFHLTGEEASHAFSRIMSKMPAELKTRLKKEIEMHLDEHSAFHLRLDKQRLALGELELSASDPVKVRVKPRLYMMKGSAAQFYGRFLG